MKRSGRRHAKHVFLIIFTVICVLAAIAALKIFVNKTPFRIGGFTFPPETSAADSESLTDAPAAETSSAAAETASPAVQDARFAVDTLILVNRDNPLPDGYEIELRSWDESHQVASVMYWPLSNMLRDMRAAGLSPRVNSAYRSVDEQNRIMGDYIDDYMNKGQMDYETASRRALDFVSLPGLSEHATGLAADISSDAGDKEMYKVFDWLEKNAHIYGFIKRYPAGKESITGYSEERWHYRYVGVKNAREIYGLGLTLEEYLGRNSVTGPEVSTSFQ